MPGGGGRGRCKGPAWRVAPKASKWGRQLMLPSSSSAGVPAAGAPRPSCVGVAVRRVVPSRDDLVQRDPVEG